MDSTNYIIITISGEGATLPVNNIVHYYDSTESVLLNSYPDSGYEFSKWFINDLTSSSVNISLDMTQNYDVTCEFKKITFDSENLIKTPGNIFEIPFYNNIFGYDRDSDISSETTDQKLTLVEYSTCHKIREIMLYNTQNIENFLSLNKTYIDVIKRNVNTFYPTTDNYDNDIFELAYNYFKKNISMYTLQFVDPAKILSSEFIKNIKVLYSNNDYLKNNQFFNELLDISDETDYYTMITVTSNFVNNMKDSLLSGLIEKMLSDFSGSEFIISIALTIIEFNSRMFGLQSLVSSINSINTYMSENCPHCLEAASKLKQYLDRILVKYSFTLNGILDTDSLLSNLDENLIEKINKVKPLISIILNNSYNEIKIKTKIDKMFLYNINFD